MILDRNNFTFLHCPNTNRFICSLLHTIIHFPQLLMTSRSAMTLGHIIVFVYCVPHIF